MKRYVIPLVLSLLCLAGCKTLAITDEPFFRYKEMQDTLDAYLARIDTSKSISPRTLVTFIDIVDMFEVGVPMLHIATTNQWRISLPVAEFDDCNTYFGIYHGYRIKISCSTKYMNYLKKGIVQSQQAKEEYFQRLKCSPKKRADDYLYWDIGEGTSYKIITEGKLRYESKSELYFQTDNFR